MLAGEIAVHAQQALFQQVSPELQLPLQHASPDAPQAGQDCTVHALFA